MSNISDKDKKDWNTFLKSTEKIEDKDKTSYKDNKTTLSKSIDLHGYTLDEANRKVSELIHQSFENNIRNLNIITGKGNRSNNQKDPYQSKDLSILKYSVPNFVMNNLDLMNKIISIDNESIEDLSSGSFRIYLKKKWL